MEASTVFNEFNRHLMEDEKPSLFFNSLADNNEFSENYPFTLLTDLRNVPQSPVHHPEGSVWNHTMLVVDSASERKDLSRDPRVLMWAALLHDLGKITNTKIRNGKITAYDHDIAGEKLASDFLSACTEEKDFITNVCALIRWHMQLLYVTNHLPFANIKKMVSEVDCGEIALLSFCDRLGRGDLKQQDVEKELGNVEYFLRKCGGYKTSKSV